MDKFTRRTAPLSDTDFNQAISSETQAPIEGAEGFGCPNDEYACNAHCRSVGYRGGYCTIWSAWNRCTCY